MEEKRESHSGSQGVAKCWLKKNMGRHIGKVIDMDELVCQYLMVSDTWVIWKKTLKRDGDTLLEKIGEYKNNEDELVNAGFVQLVGQGINRTQQVSDYHAGSEPSC
jgi:hypothetical protein